MEPAGAERHGRAGHGTERAGASESNALQELFAFARNDTLENQRTATAFTELL